MTQKQTECPVCHSCILEGELYNAPLNQTVNLIHYDGMIYKKDTPEVMHGSSDMWRVIAKQKTYAQLLDMNYKAKACLDSAIELLKKAMEELPTTYHMEDCKVPWFIFAKQFIAAGKK